jgi:hypothetical protein
MDQVQNAQSAGATTATPESAFKSASAATAESALQEGWITKAAWTSVASSIKSAADIAQNARFSDQAF